VKPGQVNEIIVGIKTAWYALDTTFHKRKASSVNELRNMPLSMARWFGFVDAVYCSAGMKSGLVQPVELVAMGRTYTSDIFIRTSVEKNRLEADLELTNSSSSNVSAEVTCQAVNDKTNEVEKTFQSKKLTVPADGKAKIAISQAWANPRLWWPEEDAAVYRMRTTVRVGGKVVDIQEETFGFREVTFEGKHCLLNGLRWHFWCWQGLSGKSNSPESWARGYRKLNHRFIRTHGRSGLGKGEEGMELADRFGIAQFAPTYINGMYLAYEFPNELVWKNFDRHVRQYVKAYRNHPSIIMWSLANENLLVNGRLGFFKEYRKWEELSASLIDTQKEVDPTRRSFFDGAGDLGGLGEVDCNHYGWRYGVGFPRCAYEYPTGPPVQPRPRERDQLYLWTGDKPLIFGEVFFYSLGTPSQAWIGGPDVFRGVKQQDAGAMRYLRVAVEGARWQDTTGICLFASVHGSFKEGFKSYYPRAVFVKEYNSSFFAGSKYERTIRVFNDGRKTDPLTLKWSLVLDGKSVHSGEKTY
ncbi:MAG TPA: hypothetical protein ENL03_03395, partial [Phycisphaerae bacterium]|nr:hypothetical protein [Phycisphaerae bacterium]